MKGLSNRREVYDLLYPSCIMAITCFLSLKRSVICFILDLSLLTDNNDAIDSSMWLACW